MSPIRLLVVSLATACILAGSRSYGRERPIPPGGDAMVEKFLARDADLLAGQEFEAAATRAEWQAIRPRLKAELFQMLGLWPVPERTPLHARVTGTLDREGPVVIEMIHFQSRPGLYVTGNLFRPRDVHGRLPAILYVCGHLVRGRDGNKTAFQDHGMWFARNGYVALLIDTLQLGEVAGVHHGTYNLGRWWWQALGYTPAGVECWNGIRAIDYLITRPDVDPGRIGVTGISGGGAATFWIAAAVVRWLADGPAPRRTWRIAGSRQAGIIAAYAALFEPAVAEVMVVDPLASHRDGPIFLNVLRVLDVPAAIGLLAPRPADLDRGQGRRLVADESPL